MTTDVHKYDKVGTVKRKSLRLFIFPEIFLESLHSESSLGEHEISIALVLATSQTLFTGHVFISASIIMK